MHRLRSALRSLLHRGKTKEENVRVIIEHYNEAIEEADTEGEAVERFIVRTESYRTSEIKEALRRARGEDSLWKNV